MFRLPRRTRSARWAAVAALAAFCQGLTLQPGLAGDSPAGPLTILQPWARATPKGATVAAAYLTIRNAGDAADRLTGIEVEVAARAGVHEMTMTGDMMTMRAMPAGVVIPAHGSLTLKPGALHFMLEGLKRQLKAGESFAGTVRFDKAGPVPVSFVVRPIAAQAPTAEIPE